MVDPLKRMKEVEDLIAKEFYFTLHALARKLNAEGKYIALVGEKGDRQECC